MYVLLEGSLFWQLRQVMRIEAWRKKYGGCLLHWLDKMCIRDSSNIAREIEQKDEARQVKRLIRQLPRSQQLSNQSFYLPCFVLSFYLAGDVAVCRKLKLFGQSAVFVR